MNKFFSLHLDLLGFITSFICAIHCMAVPLIFSFGLMGAGGFSHNHAFDFILIGLGIVIAGYTIFKDYKKYKNVLPFMVGIIGITFLLIGLNGHNLMFSVSSVLGGCMLATAHYLNWKKNHSKTRTSIS